MRNKVTLNDIAKELNISINSVSLALRNKPGLNDKTRALILATAKEKGYAMKTAETQNIFVVSSREHVSDNYFYTQLLQIVEKLIVEKGYSLLITNDLDAWTQNAALSKKLKDSNVSGILMLGDLSGKTTRQILETGVPSVALGFYIHNLKMNTIIEDNMSGMFQIVKSIKEKGYSSIGFVGVKDIVGLYERFMGFLGASIQFGYNLDPSHININITNDIREQYDEMLAYFKSLDKQLPEVFVFCHDRLAIIGMKALFSMGIRTPRDIGLVGFDNSDMAKLSIPTLTTVEVFPKSQALYAVNNLIAAIKNPKQGFNKTIIPVEFVEGATLK